jgi:hypothetical protein
MKTTLRKTKKEQKQNPRTNTFHIKPRCLICALTQHTTSKFWQTFNGQPYELLVYRPQDQCNDDWQNEKDATCGWYLPCL